MRRIALLCLLLVPSLAAAQSETESAARYAATERIVIGGSTFGSTSPLQVIGLPGALTIAGVLIADSSGNVGTSTDYPRKSTSQTISGAWTFSTGPILQGTIDLQGTLSDSTGNVTIGDLLDVSGATVLSSTLAVTLGATFSDDIAVNGGDLTSTGALNITPAGGNLKLNPSGDITLDPTGNDVLPISGYDLNLGALSAKFLTLHAAELWVETLVAQDTIATIGGRILVGPTTTLTADLSPAATSISVKHNSLANGDRVYLEANGAVEFLAITSAASGTGPYSYTVTRNLDGTGANQWYAGDAVFNTGQTGSGFIDLYSIRGIKSGSEAGPTIVGNVRLSSTFNDWAPRWAIGNLNGLYGYGATAYGVAFGDPNEANIAIDATNGIRIRDGTTNKLTMDTSGNLSLVGDIVMGTGGAIRSGATAFGTGTGYWLAHNAGTPQFRIGNPAGARLQWDGSVLTMISDEVTIDGTGIRVASDSGSAETDNNSYRFSSVASGTFYYGLYAWEPVANNAYGGKDSTLALVARNLTNSNWPRVWIAAESGSGNNYYTAELYLDPGNQNDITVPYSNPTITYTAGAHLFQPGTSSPVPWFGIFDSTSGPTSTPGYPWIVSDGAYLMINSDTSGIFLNNYVSQPVYHYAGGLTYLWDSTKNYLVWRNGSGDTGLPAFSTRSVGTKISFQDGDIGASSAEFAIGLDTSVLWFSTKTTSERFEWYQGTTNIVDLQKGGNNNTELILVSKSGLTGTDTGNVVLVDRSTSASNNVPGMFGAVSANGTYAFLWPDNSGVWMTASAFPEADGTPAQNSGTVVGAQTSALAAKDLHGEFTDNAGALDLMLRTPVYRFTYKNGAYNGEPFVGIVTDYSPEFGMYENRFLNPANALGYTIGAVKALYARIEILEARIRALENRE